MSKLQQAKTGEYFSDSLEDCLAYL